MAIMEEREVLLYTRSRSLRCWRAKRLLARRATILRS
jgi:hypothetical protein